MVIKFSRINMKLIISLNKIADNDHHKSNKFSRINIKSIYLFFKNDLKKYGIIHGYNKFPRIFVFLGCKINNSLKYF